MNQETCLICGKTAAQKWVIDVPDIKNRASYPIFECPYCGVQKSQIPPESTSSLYSETVYRSSDTRVLIRFLKRCLHYMEVRRLTRGDVAKSFCDIGCGTGDFSKFLFESGYSVITADAASSRPCDIGDRPDIPYLHFDYTTRALENQELLRGRTVILRHVLEHVDRPDAFLQQLVAHGASAFYILVPNSSGLSRKLFGKYEGLWGLPYHLWHFNRKSLEALCKKSGLEIVRSGHETIPIFLYSFYRCLMAHNAPNILLKLFKPTQLRLLLSLPFDLLSLGNVVYVLARVNSRPDHS